MWLTRISIQNPYLATMVMVALVVLGIFSFQRLSVEEYPDIRYPVAVVTTNYSGASPQVVESDVTRPIEQAINGLNGIKHLRSYSFEGQSVVVVEFDLSINPSTALQDVRDKVGSVQGSFRREVSVPTVDSVNPNDETAITLVVASKTMSPREVTTWADQVLRKRLQTVPGVGRAKIVGGVKREVRINLNPYRLQALGVGAAEVIDALRADNRDFPAGSVTENTRDLSVRVEGRIKDAQDFAKINVGYRNGSQIRLGDVAQVVDGQQDEESLALFNGQRALSVELTVARGANIVATAAGVHQLLAALKPSMPADIQVEMIRDQSTSVRASLSNVENTLLEGSLLTILIVFLFLGSWRSTVITGLTLPIALIGTLFALAVMGFTLNVMTLLALSLSIGLLIDDAIVVRENIVRHANLGKSHYRAALDGTNEIGLAVLATTLTVVAVFLPVGFMGGYIGKWFTQFALTVVVAVLISLFVSFTLDPMLSSVWPDPHHHGDRHRGPLGRVLDWFEGSLDRVAQRYAQLMTWILQHRKTTLAVALALLLGSFALLPVIGAEFVPQSDENRINLTLKTAPGSRLEYTEAKVQQVEAVLRRYPEIRTVYTNIGGGFAEGRNQAGLTVFTVDKTERSRSIFALFAPIRADIARIGGIRLESIAADGGPGGGDKPIRVGIRGADFETLGRIAEQLTVRLKTIPGVVDITASQDERDPAFAIAVKRDAASSLGVSVERVGETLSTLIAGNVASTWEAPDGQNYDVRVQVPKPERQRELLELMTVASTQRNAAGVTEMIPLSTVTHMTTSSVPRQINRMDQAREVSISANMMGADAQTVFSAVSKVLASTPLPPNYQFDMGGDSQNMNESFGYAMAALALGVIFIYMILAAQFRSFLQPIAIMMSLPLALIGVFVALLLWRDTLNMFSIIGVIMLMGLAAKNGILLVDFINHARAQGLSRHDAIVEAGRVRLRPIMMTSFAMIFGMLPLALSQGQGSETQAPMAHALIGGIISSTLLTLIVVPVVYSYLDTMGAWVLRKMRGSTRS